MRNPIRLKNLRPRLLPFILAAIGLLAFVRPQGAGFVVGLPLVLAGLALRGWGAGHLSKNDALTTTGPYAHLRHPLYAGTLLIAAGFALILGGIVSIALLALLFPWFVFHYFPRKELSESARLAALHGAAFSRYRASVPALWPRWSPFVPAPDAPAPRARERRWRLERYSDNNELGTLLAVVAVLVVLALRVRAELV